MRTVAYRLSYRAQCSALKALCYCLLCDGVGTQVSITEQSWENWVLMKHSKIT
jgi:hypothetical protein